MAIVKVLGEERIEKIFSRARELPKKKTIANRKEDFSKDLEILFTDKKIVGKVEEVKEDVEKLHCLC